MRKHLYIKVEYYIIDLISMQLGLNGKIQNKNIQDLLKTKVVPFGLSNVSANTSSYGSVICGLDENEKIISIRMICEKIADLKGFQVTPVYVYNNTLFFTYYAPNEVETETFEYAVWEITYC